MTRLSAARPVAAACIVCASLLIARPPAAAQGFDSQLAVRLYDFTALDRSVRTAAVDEARAILADAALTSTWHDGSAARTACAPERGDLVVRVVRENGVQDVNWRQALGYSVVDPVAGTGVLATIYINRVEMAARRSGADVARLLGRAIAHEVGHLVLRTNSHADRGLMRAVWTEQELARNAPADWVFAPADRRQLRAAVQQIGRAAAR